MHPTSVHARIHFCSLIARFQFGHLALCCPLLILLILIILAILAILAIINLSAILSFTILSIVSFRSRPQLLRDASLIQAAW